MTMYAVLAAIILAFGFGGGWKTATWRHDAAELERTKLEQRERFNKIERVDQAAEKHEQFKAQEEVRYVTITKEVDRIVERPVYRDAVACWDTDGLRAANASISGSPIASEPAPAVPRPRSVAR